MAWLTGRVQFDENTKAREIQVGECPYIKKGGRFFHKETGEEIFLKKYDLLKYTLEKLRNEKNS